MQAAGKLRQAADLLDEAITICSADRDIATALGSRMGGLKSYAEWLETGLLPGLARRAKTPVVIDRTGITCRHCDNAFGTSTIGVQPGITWESFVQMVAQSHSSSCPALSVDPR